MDLLSLAIPLTPTFHLTNLCVSAFASTPCFFLDACASLLPLCPRQRFLRLVVFAHGSGFPFTDATSHELRAVGFPQIGAINKEIEDADIAPVIVHFKLPASKPTQEARADIPAPLKRESAALRDTIAMPRRLAIDGLHEQQFEIIARSQILWHSALRSRVFPMDGTFLPSKLVPVLLVIIDNGLIEAPLQFFQCQTSSFC